MVDFVFSDVVDVNRLQRLQASFAEATELGAIAVDARGVPVTATSHFTEFCKRMRADPIHSRLCRLCDAHGSCQAVINGRPYVYKCHAGLADISVALQVGQVYLGAVLCGQVRLIDRQLDPIWQVSSDEPWQSDRSLAELYEDIPGVRFSKLMGAADALYELSREISERPLAERPASSPPSTSREAAHMANIQLGISLVVRACLAGELPEAMDATTDVMDAIWRIPTSKDQITATRNLQDRLLALIAELASGEVAGHSKVVLEHRAAVAARGSQRYTEQLFVERLVDAVVTAVEASHSPVRVTLRTLANKMTRQWDSELTLEKAAEWLAVSPSYLSRSFKAQFGETFAAFRVRRRIARAKLLLAYTTTPIGQIASQAGFNRAGYFAKVFRAATGVTPMAFRAAVSSR